MRRSKEDDLRTDMASGPTLRVLDDGALAELGPLVTSEGAMNGKVIS